MQRLDFVTDFLALLLLLSLRDSVVDHAVSEGLIVTRSDGFANAGLSMWWRI